MATEPPIVQAQQTSHHCATTSQSLATEHFSDSISLQAHRLYRILQSSGVNVFSNEIPSAQACYGVQSKSLSTRTSSACMIWQKSDLLIGICTFYNSYNNEAGAWNARAWLGRHLKKHKRWQKIIVHVRIYHLSREKLLPSWSKLSSDIALYLHLKFYSQWTIYYLKALN